MHSKLTRRVRHPRVSRIPSLFNEVAQGAVESPWLYSNFIDALARELKEVGVGIWIAGRQVALLMYADDIVLLANSQDDR